MSAPTKDVPVVTIHDSILTTREHVEIVKRVMVQNFQALGLIADLKETDYGND